MSRESNDRHSKLQFVNNRKINICSVLSADDGEPAPVSTARVYFSVFCINDHTEKIILILLTRLSSTIRITYGSI